MGESINKEKDLQNLKDWITQTNPCYDCKRKEKCGELSIKVTKKAAEVFPLKVECWWYESNLMDELMDMFFPKKNE